MSRFVLAHAPRHLPPWLIFDVRQKNMSVIKAHEILERKQRIQKAPLYLAVLGEVAISVAFLSIAWSSLQSTKGDLHAPLLVLGALVIYQTAQNARTRRRLEVAEL